MAKFEIDTQAIRELAALLEETGLTEIEVGDKDRRVRVARQGTPVAAVAMPAPVAAAAATATAPAPTADDPAHHPGAVRSPMVGTVYLSPEPGAAAFIKVGDTVAQGQTLLIIEAMKVMNQIPAARGGKVARILVENGSPVEYGQALLILE